ncbi:hypothetical protein L1887_15751 [Cichorium endivia]|nr:hypothetical protein L1887_15751 [Cichorium endivia]
MNHKMSPSTDESTIFHSHNFKTESNNVATASPSPPLISPVNHKTDSLENHIVRVFSSPTSPIISPVITRYGVTWVWFVTMASESDMNDTIVALDGQLYDEEGKFAVVRRPNSKLTIEINGTKFEIVDAIGSSGLDMKILVSRLFMLALVR